MMSFLATSSRYLEVLIRRLQASVSKQIASPTNDVGLFLSCQTREGNLDQFLRHENHSYPPSLSGDGSLRLGAKSDLLACMKDVFETKQDAPAATCVVLDGAAIIQMLKSTAAKNFDDYASQIIISFLATKLRDTTELDLVWDTYKDDSLQQDQNVVRGVVAAAAIPGNWRSFLGVDENKMELFAFLIQIAHKWFDEKSKQLVITSEKVFTTHPAATKRHS